MLRAKKTGLSLDFHSHILPHMDDGAENMEIALRQLSSLSEQGVRHVVVTPHFYLHRENIESYLTRRQNRAEQLVQAASAARERLPGISVGAEVYLEQGLLQMGGIDRLRMANTDYVLFELPYTGIGKQHAELLFNLCARGGVRPLLAHLDRYLNILTDELLTDLLSLENVVVQINNEAFSQRQSAKFALRLIRQGVPVVLGSDTHNMLDRRPNFDLSNKFLSSKLKGGAFRDFVKAQIDFLHGKV